MDVAQLGTVPDDLIQPFQIETLATRGRLVRLGPLVDAVLGEHDYPPPVANLLGELLALAALVSAALKFDGVFSLQAKGDGPITMLVADVTTEGGMRGYAQFSEEKLAALGDKAQRRGGGEPVPHLLGAGYLAFTVDQGPETERYQGIVELTGATLADCAHNYFRQSEQLDAVVKLAVGQTENGAGNGAGAAWRAAGLMVQRLPNRGRALVSGEAGDDDTEDDWRRAVVLMGSSTTDELLDPGLHPHDLLYRLFHEDGVRVFQPQHLVMECRCSRTKVTTMLKSFPRREIEELRIDDQVIVTCEFCGVRYEFDEPALDAVYAS